MQGRIGHSFFIRNRYGHVISKHSIVCKFFLERNFLTFLFRKQSFETKYFKNGLNIFQRNANVQAKQC